MSDLTKSDIAIIKSYFLNGHDDKALECLNNYISAEKKEWEIVRKDVDLQEKDQREYCLFVCGAAIVMIYVAFLDPSISEYASFADQSNEMAVWGRSILTAALSLVGGAIFAGILSFPYVIGIYFYDRFVGVSSWGFYDQHERDVYYRKRKWIYAISIICVILLEALIIWRMV